MKNCVLHLQKGYVPEHYMSFSVKDMATRDELKWVKEIVPSEGMCEIVSKVKEKKGFSQTRRPTKYVIGKKLPL